MGKHIKFNDYGCDKTLDQMATDGWNVRQVCIGNFEIRHKDGSRLLIPPWVKELVSEAEKRGERFVQEEMRKLLGLDDK